MLIYFYVFFQGEVPYHNHQKYIQVVNLASFVILPLLPQAVLTGPAVAGTFLHVKISTYLEMIVVTVVMMKMVMNSIMMVVLKLMMVILMNCGACK